MDETMNNNTITGFSELLASKQAVPGGGAATALVSSLAASLVLMVGNLTVGKKKYADVEEEILAVMARAEEIRAEMVQAVDDDAAAFYPLSELYALPKDEPSRDEKLEEALKNAASVPYRVLARTAELIELMLIPAEKGSRLAVSDIATAAGFAKGALEGAAANVRINTKLMKNRETAEAINEATDRILAEAGEQADRIFEFIYGGSV